MSDDDSDSMMRSMMGFSSFGTQRSTGKKASDAPPPTGSNVTPVAKRAKTGAGQYHLLVYSNHVSGQSDTSSAPPTIAEIMQQSGISPSSAPPTNQSELAITALPTVTTSSTISAPGATSISTTTFQTTNTSPPGLTTMQPLPRSSDGASFARPTQQQSTSSIAYTSPTNPSYRLTPTELTQLRGGRPNARGDTVYFKPSFIDGNPWKALQDVAREERRVGNEN